MAMNNKFKNKRITVMGLGMFEGGLGITRFLSRQGARVTVTDLKNEKELSQSLKYLKDLPVSYKLGGHRAEDFINADLVIVNPAVPKCSEFIRIARKNHVPIDTEMNIFFKLCPAPIIGVTGSNGKSTTTMLIKDMLQQTPRKTWMGGNIGVSLLTHLEEIKESDVVVLELSSFQLEALSAIKKSPQIGVITNVSPNHLDRHGDMNSYIQAKKNIFLNQKSDDYVILNYDDPELRMWARECRGKILWYSTTTHTLKNGAFTKGNQIVLSVNGKTLSLPCISEIRLPGRHNLQNILAASCAAYLTGAGEKEIIKTANTFKGLEHRLEFVREVSGIRFFNDSKATTPESAIAAITSFQHPVILIAGGYDKGSDFTNFAEVCAQHCKGVILIGATSDKLRELIAKKKEKESPFLLTANNLSEALQRAKKSAVFGDNILLSPACASYDMFHNYEERGRQFKNLVYTLI